MAIALSASFVGIVLRVMLTRWTGYAVNEAVARPEALRAPLSPYLTTLAALAAATFVSSLVARYFVFRSAHALEFDLRVLLYRHLARLPFTFYDRLQTGQVVSRANADVRSLQMYLSFAPFLALQFASLFVALYFMVRIDLVMTVAVVATLPAVFVASARLRRAVFPLSWLVQARMADIATIVDENVQGVRVVKGFAAERSQIHALAAAGQRLLWASVGAVRVRARFGPLLENLPRLGDAVILLYGGLLVLDGRMGPGEIVVFMAYLTMVQGPFRMLGFLVTLHQRAAASAQRIYEVLDEEPSLRDDPDAVDLVSCRGDIELRGVRFGYSPDAPVLRDLDLVVPARQTIAIVGRTGSGKSTLAQLVPRFYDVDEGAVLVDGHDVRTLTTASLRGHVGICFDEPFLFSASIHDNIAYGRPDATREEVIAAATASGAHDFVITLDQGYDTVVGERGYTLSGGQRQRIAIARVLLESPAILILDDATSAVDVNVELRIHDAIRGLIRDRTTIIVAHRLSTIALADRVVLLEDGRIVADGTHADLLASVPAYAELLTHLASEDEEKAERVEARAAAAARDGGFGDAAVDPVGAPEGGLV
ncbi:MAG: ABC transporter ATP-binding protein/permease [Actinobacteria bacterium]|nr:ABC transporter ATP-binding protein/permease [Actinomycetota bacterium]